MRLVPIIWIICMAYGMASVTSLPKVTVWQRHVGSTGNGQTRHGWPQFAPRVRIPTGASHPVSLDCAHAAAWALVLRRLCVFG